MSNSPGSDVGRVAAGEIPVGTVMLVPDHCGGLLHPEGGKARRLRVMHSIEGLADSMVKPGLITLTVDRRWFKSPEEAYERGAALLSKLLTERLGLVTWVRVLEVQSQSGDGWPHWHVLVDIGGTEWYVPSRNWVRMREFAVRLQEVWREQMRMGTAQADWKIDRGRVASYVVKYLVKGWPAIPEWVGRRLKAPRLVQFSKSARLHAAVVEVLGRSGRRDARVEGKPREQRTVFERLAASGLRMKVVERTAEGSWRWLGEVAGVWADALGPLVAAGECSTLAEADVQGRGWKARLVANRREGEDSRMLVARLNAACVGLGIAGRAEEMRKGFLEGWRVSWWMMQAERSGT